MHKLIKSSDPVYFNIYECIRITLNLLKEKNIFGMLEPPYVFFPPPIHGENAKVLNIPADEMMRYLVS